MKLRSWAQFTSTELPDDSIPNEDWNDDEDDDDEDNGDNDRHGPDFIQWGGKNVSEALAVMLTDLGYEKVSAPECLEHAGWDLYFKAGRRAFACRITIIDDYLIGFRDDSFSARVLGAHHHPSFIELLKRVGAALASDSRFENVRWFADNELFTGAEGHAIPVEE